MENNIIHHIGLVEGLNELYIYLLRKALGK